MERMAASPGQSEPQLTARQRDVLRLILEGRRMKEIAAALQLSTRTVETHKYQMMEVLGVTLHGGTRQVCHRASADRGVNAASRRRVFASQ